MPKTLTKKGKLIHWLKHNPGVYRARKLALQHHMSQSHASSILSELETSTGWVERWLRGRNTMWHIFNQRLA